MENVVSLRGEPIYSPEQNAEVVKSLEGWLEKARAGEVGGIAIAALYRDETTGYSASGMATRALVGALFALTSTVSSKHEA